MSEYLTKEEIRQWRSSLEKITLEEYAQRLGKKIEEEKETEDIVDIVMHHIVDEDYTSSYNPPALEKIITIGSKAFSKEKEIKSLSRVVTNKKTNKNSDKSKKKKIKFEKSEKYDDINIYLSRDFTEREKTVFEYFVSHKNCVVYAKELAKILDLPRDYVYKYIKNIRAKIKGDALYNAENGGFVLKV